MKHSHLLVLGAGIAVAATVAASFRGISHLNASDGAAASAPARVFSPRLSIEQTFRRCTMLGVSSDRTVPREQCDTHGVPMVNLAALADSAESSDPSSLQASALRALAAPNSTERSVDAAITMLTRALRLSPNKVPLLVDLSGAYLVRAELTNNPRDLLEALENALEALKDKPRNPAALFNSALAIEALGLDGEAALAWEDYLRADSTSEWADEAKRRLRSIQHPPPPPAPRPESSLDEVRTFAMRDPQRARLLGWDTVLGQWGTAQEAGNKEEAARLLQLADRLGAALVSRGGDASLADAVRAIRAAADDPVAILTLARAHRMYARAQVLYPEQDTRDSAKALFEQVLAARPRSPTLMQSAEAFQAATHAYAGNSAGPESTYKALLTRIDSVRHPALAGRVQWMRGRLLGRSKHYIEARESHQFAARMFERAGETEFAAYALAQYGEAAYYQRDTLAAYPAMHRALLALRKYRSSRWLHNTLFVLANSATTDGMPLAAEKILDEDAVVARRMQASSAIVEALTSLALIHAVTGRRQETAENLDSATALVAQMANTTTRNNFEATIGFRRVLVDTSSTAIAGLDSAVAYFAKTEDPYWMIPTLLLRVDVRLAHGQLAAATADLDTATARIRDLSHDQGTTGLRIAMMERAHHRFDQLVMLHVRPGDTVGALRAVERGRVSFTPGTPATTPRRLAAPRGQVALEYALIGDTLLTWTLRGNDVRLRRTTLDRGDLLRRIERVDARLESRAPESLVRPDLARLYDLLVRPVERELGPPDTPLVILADGEVAGVPFAVLRDSARGRYLLEDHPHRFAATLADAARPAPRAGGAGRRTLLVADPAFDRSQNLRLYRLRGARAEVDSLGTLYPDSMLLAGAGATRQALIERAARAGIIHYAGHAVFDDARPERSFLVLADSDTTGHLTAEAVNGLRLGGVRLVVLSACSTMRSREGRSGGLAGLSGALLAAGAGGVVGSLWEVDDGQTEPVMLAFHRAYRQNGDAAAALRVAQREMLRTRKPFATWAGFRYVGR